MGGQVRTTCAIAAGMAFILAAIGCGQQPYEYPDASEDAGSQGPETAPRDTGEERDTGGVFSKLFSR